MAEQNLATLIWDIAELLRGDFKQSEYGRVILPFTVLRRLECVLEPTREAVVQAAATVPAAMADDFKARTLNDAAGASFHNTSGFTIATAIKSAATEEDRRENLVDYVARFSPNIRSVFLDRFKFGEQLQRLADANLLLLVAERFAAIALHPDEVTNVEMGNAFEELIRKFAEAGNETAGEHFTPREVIRMMVDLLFVNEGDRLDRPGAIRWIYDPACGTGGMLSVAEEYLRERYPHVAVELFGQELNPEGFAICRSDMVLKGQDGDNIAFGNTLADDRHQGRRFHYCLCNPPFGVDWKKSETAVRREGPGTGGRFDAGLPAIRDGQLLFLQHMIAKMRDDADGTRIAIVMNGSPLFTGGAGSGESEIRRWILENDWLEAIVALPTQIFYNTGIQTYVWLLTNRKRPDRAGRVQLVDASDERFWRPMKKSLGDKRRELSKDGRELVARIYGERLDGGGEFQDISRILPREAFGYRRITIERPLRLRVDLAEDALERLPSHKVIAGMKLEERETLGLILLDDLGIGESWPSRDAFLADLDEAARERRLRLKKPVRKTLVELFGVRDPAAPICTDDAGEPEPDPALRDQENVPMLEDIGAWFAREVRPHFPDAWINEADRDPKDGQVGRVAYEINVNRFFYRYTPPRPLEAIDRDLRAVEAEILRLLQEVADGAAP